MGLEDRKLMAIDSIPEGLSADIDQIQSGQAACSTFDVENLHWNYLMVQGAGDSNAPWDRLRPYQFVTEDPTSYTTTSTYDGTTYTTTASRSATATNGPGSGGEGSWDQSYELHTTYQSTTSGPDASGRDSQYHVSEIYDLVWHGWSDGGGTTHYKVTEDNVTDDGTDLTDPGGGSFTSHVSSAVDGHLMAEGEVDSFTGTLLSGDFTYKGNLTNNFSLDDSVGGPTSPGGGYAANASASTTFKLDQSGSLIPDDSNQGTIEITNSAQGDVSLADDTGAFLGYSRDDGDTVTSTYTGKAGNAPPPTGTQGTIDANGPRTPLKVPTGKHVVYVVDRGDQGWMDWSPESRAKYAQDHGIDPNKTPTGNVANGEQLYQALKPPGDQFIEGSGVAQVVQALGKEVDVSGLIDVLVIGDHAAPGYQQLGQGWLTPSGGYINNLNQIVPFIRPGGTLVMTGCAVFGTVESLTSWQNYATDHNITIMGSVSKTNPSPGIFQGVWVILTPGGTPPTVFGLPNQ